MSRVHISPSQMDLPPAATPRPGDEVVWYVNAQRATGRYVGYNGRGKPVVCNIFGSQSGLESFDCVRIKDAKLRIGPNWQSLPHGSISLATAKEKEEFSRLLQKHIPPGPTYIELIEEIWHRGYEVYIVGGTVRDVISGDPPNDVDIVTTMPITKFEPLLSAMFKNLVSISEKNGFARLGGRGSHGDPFIDLKLFCHCGSGTPDALFGSDFKLDIGLRDFACNTVYYDPINCVFIDPSLRGMDDSRDKLLSLVCDPQARTPQARGEVAIRYFKFKMRGYSGDANSDEKLALEFVPCISSMQSTHRVTYVKRQILSKLPSSVHSTAISQLEEVMRNSGFSDVWEQNFAKIASDFGA